MFDFTTTCLDSTPSFLGIFDLSIAPLLLFYAYVPIATLSIIVGLIYYFKSPYKNITTPFLILTIIFSVYTLNELIQWVLVPASLMYFAWSLSLLLQALIILFSFKFIYVQIYKESIIPDVVGRLILLPILLFLPTTLNLTSFNIIECEAQTGYLWFYLYFIFAVYLIFLISLSIKQMFTWKEDSLINLHLLLVTIVFNTVFFFSNFIGDITYIHEINLLGPVGMLLLIIYSSYINLRFKIFKVKTFQAQLLVILLIFLLASQFFLVNELISKLIILVTLLIASVASFYLVKSVRREVTQREQIEQLAVRLERANARLKELDKQKSEFVSIASHQLRSPLTAIRGYAAMLKEGSYGTMPDTANEPLNRIHESAKLMALSIEDFLNVSRIESGNMKYELAEFNLREQAEHIVDDLRAEALKVGLVLSYKSDITSQGCVNADIGKTQQILHNLINNSLKYTQKGTVTVFVHEDLKLKKLYVEIIDTGIGMSPDTIDILFAKFTRAKNANSVNTKGTGLGLFVAREMARAMQGEITAHSAGDGLGSHFVLELPLVR